MNTPILVETKRLRLREFNMEDLEALTLLDSDPEVMRYISDGRPREANVIESSLKLTLEYYRNHPGLGVWANELRDGTMIGWACLKNLDKTEEIEVGYRYYKAHWGQGYATEAAQALVQHGFESIELQEIVGITHPGNLASQRVLQKAGLQPDGSGHYYEADCLRFLIKAEDSKAGIQP